MFYVVVYDIAQPRRLVRTLKTCRQFLNWVQKSVFEGILTDRQFESLRYKLMHVIDKEEDSVIFYKIRNTEVVNKMTLGKEKNQITNII